MQGDVLGFIKNRPGNLLINGAFEFNQRFGTTLNSSASSYGLDRWFFNLGTSVARVAVVGQAFEYAMEAIATAAQNNHLQRIESSTVKHLRGKKATFSIMARLDSGSISAVMRLKTAYANVKDDFSAVTAVDDSVLVQKDGNPLDGTYRKFQFTFTVTNEMADNGFYIHFGDFGSATNTIQFAQAMLNENENAPSFERAGNSVTNELKLCQRYFEKSYDVETQVGAITRVGIFGISMYTTSGAEQSHNFLTRKRIIPVMVFYDTAGNINKLDAAGTPNQSIFGTITVSESRFAGGFPGSSYVREGHYTTDAEL